MIRSKPFLVSAIVPALVLVVQVPSILAASWQEVDKIFGQEGKALPGGVQKYGWPRSDLRVILGGIPVEPALALGSWAAFKETTDGKAIAMGDLVLLGTEVNPVIRTLQAGGFEVLAIHNHLIGEKPRLLYLHFMGRGEPSSLARTLVAALAKTKTPMKPSKSPGASTGEEKILQTVQSMLGRKGSMAGRVLQVGVPRAQKVEDEGTEIPRSMGVASGINFEVVGRQVATTGDFVLTADEVNPVIRELEASGIAIEALHSHMLRESPRLFFMHFWGVGTPEKIAEGIKAALSKVATK